jgi:hypothetical protein
LILIPPISPQTKNVFQEAWFLEQVRRAIQELQGLFDESWTYLHLVGDFSNTSDTPEDVTGLSFTGEANTLYEVEVLGAYETTNALPGLVLSLTLPSGKSVGITQTQ